ncbi:heavy metal-binding domain-containing protein [Williamsia sp. 1135]|uniref:heavy metal-binding domain-containing protein n=1 Tax=Williamsia sp. 1135 TaxID=1889262 RepID=UPI000A11D192|nr:heavy metal-binding domain-containing protein [Williamsia sp. 1135]ORM37564.1 heavy metal-binding domain-containing protein [Williamsia sp. 1135]
MNTATRLTLYGAGLVVTFGATFVVAAAVVPDRVARDWTASAEHAAHTPTDTAAAPVAEAPPVRGVSVAADGYALTAVVAPTRVGESDELAFTITGPDARPVTGFETSHDKQLHAIIVASDGSNYRHVHPTMDAVGRWSLPWQWPAAGSYRVFADFVPAATGTDITLSSTVTVAGEVAPPATRPASSTDEVAGYQVSLTGDLTTAGASTLTARISRDGQPVTTLQPYLGAYGHLVALREGDLAYLHVHPEGAAPTGPEQLSGPDVQFATAAPTPGRYWLYFDFQVDGQVHTAEFVLNAAGPAASTPSAPTASPPPAPAPTDAHGGH